MTDHQSRQSSYSNVLLLFVVHSLIFCSFFILSFLRVQHFRVMPERIFRDARDQLITLMLWIHFRVHTKQKPNKNIMYLFLDIIPIFLQTNNSNRKSAKSKPEQNVWYSSIGVNFVMKCSSFNQNSVRTNRIIRWSVGWSVINISWRLLDVIWIRGIRNNGLDHWLVKLFIFFSRNNSLTSLRNQYKSLSTANKLLAIFVQIIIPKRTITDVFRLKIISFHKNRIISNRRCVTKHFVSFSILFLLLKHSLHSSNKFAWNYYSLMRFFVEWGEQVSFKMHWTNEKEKWTAD